MPGKPVINHCSSVLQMGVSGSHAPWCGVGEKPALLLHALPPPTPRSKLSWDVSKVENQPDIFLLYFSCI
jgi:hypothetical protein